MDFCCSQCRMTFRSSLLLDKHKEKFCIGGELVKQETSTPLNMMDRVRELQRRRQEQRRRAEELQRQEGGQGAGERLIPGERPRPGAPRPAPHRDIHSEPPGRASRGLWGAGERGQDRGLSGEHNRSQPALRTLQNQTLSLERHREHSVRLQEQAARRRAESGKERRLSELRRAESGTERRLSELRRAESGTERRLSELRAQESRNTHLLEALLEQLQKLNTQPLAQGFPNRHRDSAQQDRAQHMTQTQTQTHTRPGHTYIPVYGGGGLSAEISALRLSYLQNGGCEPAILAQLQDLLDEALQVERHRGPGLQTSQHHRDRSTRRKAVPQPRERPPRPGLSTGELRALEQENQRLQEEISQALLKRRRRGGGRTRRTQQPSSSPAGPAPQQQISALQMDVDLLRHEVDLQNLRRQISSTSARRPRSPLLHFPPLVQVSSETPGLLRLSVDGPDNLDPAPYDPTAGLAVFYDCVLGLCPSYRACRLLVSLYSGDQELGSPAPLPLAYCEPAGLSALAPPPPQHARGGVAVLSTRQAVPRLQPSSSLSLVFQLQALGGYDTRGEEVMHLVPRGWAKVDLFDRHNRVLSGRWKVLIRVLPVQPSLTSGQINTVPQLDSAELYVRIVNARDADSQSSEAISPRLYRYPPLVKEKSCFSPHLHLPEVPHLFPQLHLPPRPKPSALLDPEPDPGPGRASWVDRGTSTALLSPGLRDLSYG